MERTETAGRLSKGAEFMDIALQMSTGLDQTDRKLVTYWTMATHMLPRTDLFPLLALIGPLQTGKSKTLDIIACFAHNPNRFTVRNASFAVIRDLLCESYERTAIIEEADEAKAGPVELEHLISDRYHRKSAELRVNKKGFKDKWESMDQRIFGATVLHRRVAFSDSAIDGRTVSVRFRNVKRNDYVDATKTDWLKSGYTNTANLLIDPVEIDRPNGVSERTFNSYSPLLMFAKIIGDNAFPASIHTKMEMHTESIHESQSFEPDGLVVRAMMAITECQTFTNIKLSTISNWIWDNNRVKLESRQVASIARAMGFTTKESHGVTVLAPTPARLARACVDCGYDNQEEIDALRQLAKITTCGWARGLFDVG